jgi:hypothetical protein
MFRKEHLQSSSRFFFARQHKALEHHVCVVGISGCCGLVRRRACG